MNMKSGLELSEEMKDFLKYGSSIDKVITLYLDILKTKAKYDLDYNDIKFINILGRYCLERMLERESK